MSTLTLDQWLISQINFATHMQNIRTQIKPHIPDCILEQTIDHELITPAIQHVIQTETIDLPPIACIYACDDHAIPADTLTRHQQQIIRTELSLWGRQLDTLPQRIPVTIPWQTNNPLFKFICQKYDSNNQVSTTFEQDNPQWIAYHAHLDSILAHTILQDCFIALPVIQPHALPNLFPKMYNPLRKEMMSQWPI